MATLERLRSIPLMSFVSPLSNRTKTVVARTQYRVFRVTPFFFCTLQSHRKLARLHLTLSPFFSHLRQVAPLERLHNAKGPQGLDVLAVNGREFRIHRRRCLLKRPFLILFLFFSVCPLRPHPPLVVHRSLCVWGGGKPNYWISRSTI